MLAAANSLLAAQTLRSLQTVPLPGRPHACFRMCPHTRIVRDFIEIVSPESRMVVTHAHASDLVGAGGWCREQKTASSSESRDPQIFGPPALVTSGDTSVTSGDTSVTRPLHSLVIHRRQSQRQRRCAGGCANVLARERERERERRSTRGRQPIQPRCRIPGNRQCFNFSSVKEFKRRFLCLVVLSGAAFSSTWWI